LLNIVLLYRVEGFQDRIGNEGIDVG